MSDAAPVSSFQRMQQMGPSSGGGSGVGISRSLFGMDMEQQFMVNFLSEKDIQITGFNNMEEGLLAKLLKMRGDGFLGGIIFDAFASAEEAFNGLNDFGGGEGGGGGDGGGSNHAFSGLPPMDQGFGPISDVPPYMLGQLSPDSSPSMSRGRGMGMGGGMGDGGMGM